MRRRGGNGENETGRPTRSASAACALGFLVFSSCGVGVAAAPVGADIDSVKLVGANLYSASETLDECVQRHVAGSGGAAAVRELSCPGVEGERCAPPDLTSLRSLENLKVLDLSHRCIVDVSPIATLAQIEQLELRGNQVEDIRPLGALRELRSLGLANNWILSTWGLTSQLPFSQWSKLEVLNLENDGTISNLMPLAALTSLQELHLENFGLKSIRPLAALRSLRKLHVDHNMFEDLSPLAEFTQLEELTASDNLISSIEPLRQLVQAGSLRSVSLDETCVASCNELAQAGASCTNPRTSCDPSEITARGHELAVPFDYVEQVPPAGLPAWSQDQIDLAFERLTTTEAIDWGDNRSGCDGRATASVDLLAGEFPALTKVYAYGNLRMLAPDDDSGFLWFDYHVTVAARTDRGFVVFDPALEDHPLTMREWFSRLVDSKGASLNFSCIDYHKVGGSTGSQCENYVDERGDFLVDDLHNLRGALCNSSDCG